MFRGDSSGQPLGWGRGLCSSGGGGVSAVCPLWLQSPLSRELCGLSRCFLPLGPKGEARSTSESGPRAELQHQGQGGAGWALGGPHLHGSPCSQSLGQNRPGAAQPTVGTRVLWAPWPGLLACSSASLSAQVVRAPGTRARSPPASGPGAQTPGTFPAAPAPSPRVCVCRLRLPAWADSARLPLREHQPDSPVLSSGYSGGDFSIGWFQQKPGSTRNTS